MTVPGDTYLSLRTAASEAAVSVNQIITQKRPLLSAVQGDADLYTRTAAPCGRSRRHRSWRRNGVIRPFLATLFLTPDGRFKAVVPVITDLS